MYTFTIFSYFLVVVLNLDIRSHFPVPFPERKPLCLAPFFPFLEL